MKKMNFPYYMDNPPVTYKMNWFREAVVIGFDIALASILAWTLDEKFIDFLVLIVFGQLLFMAYAWFKKLVIERSTNHTAILYAKAINHRVIDGVSFPPKEHYEAHNALSYLVNVFSDETVYIPVRLEATRLHTELEARGVTPDSFVSRQLFELIH